MRPAGATAIEPATEHAAMLRDAFNAAFADYLVGPPSIAPADWPGFMRRQGVDAAASRVALRDARVVGFALIGRFGDPVRSRLATMGVLPGARGSGVAKALLDRVIDESRARGEASLELEVFAQNDRALALYRSRGFAPVAPLYGYEREAGPAPSEPPPSPIALAEACAWLRALPGDLLPYQVSAAALEANPAPLLAWRSGAAQLVFEPRGEVPVVIASLVDRGAHQHDARRLARSLASRYPQASLRVAPLQRADLGGEALEAEGWRRLALHQLLMRRAA